MSDRPAYADPGDDLGRETDPRSTAGTPRWVKVAGAIALVVVLLVVGMLVFGGGSPGGHGPARHTGSGDADDRTPAPSAPEGRTPPAGTGENHAPPPGIPHGPQGP